MIWGQDNSAGEKDFEFFQVFDDLRPRHFCRRNNLWIFSVIDDLRPRQFCRRKRLWIFPGYWWFAAKTNLQVKKSLKFSRLLMICVSENSAGEKVLEYFQVVADLRLRQFCRWKSLWIFSGYRWSADKTNLQAKKSLNVFGILMICGQDNFAREKNLWIFPSCWWFAAKTILQVKKSLNTFGVSMICG